MVQIKSAVEEDRELYRNMFNMYQNDLSAYFDDFYEVDKNGYYDYNTIDEYFVDDNSITPFIIEYEKRSVGVLVLTTSPYVKQGCDYCIQEFFLLGYYRGKGIAEQVCKELFNKFHGKYCILVLNKNKRAICFWEKITAKNATFLSKTESDKNAVIYEFQA